MVRTANHKARTKNELVTVFIRSRSTMGETEPMRLRYPYAGRQAVTSSESRYSIVIETLSNVGNECAEILVLYRRQHPSTDNAVWLSEHSGVLGTACREGYSEEHGRSDECVVAA